MASPGIHTPSDPTHTLVAGLANACNVLGQSVNSLRTIHKLPSQDSTFVRLRQSIVSEVMLDNEYFHNNMHALITTTMEITHAFHDTKTPEDEQFIVNLSQSVIESNGNRPTMMVRYSNAVWRLKQIKDQIEGEIDKQSSSTRDQAPLPSMAQPKGGFVTTILKMWIWISKLVSHVKRGRVQTKSQPGGHLSIERGDLLVLASALNDLDAVFQSMSDLVVSIGEYIRVSGTDTKTLALWFTANPGKDEEIMQSCKDLIAGIRRFEGNLSRFEDIIPEVRIEGRTADIEDGITELE